MKKKFMREEKNILFLTRLKTAVQKLDKKKGQLYVGIGVFILMTLLGNLISSFLYNLQYVLPMKLPMQNIFGFLALFYIRGSTSPSTLLVLGYFFTSGSGLK